MKKLVSRFKDNFAASKTAEQGDIVQTILIIAVFVTIVVIVGGLLWSAISDRADDVADCIKGANPVGGGGMSQDC